VAAAALHLVEAGVQVALVAAAARKAAAVVLQQAEARATMAVRGLPQQELQTIALQAAAAALVLWVALVSLARLEQAAQA
jgi:hypothetical protein